MPVAGRLRGEHADFRAGKTDYTARVNGEVMEGFARTAGVDSKFSANRIAK